MKQHTENVQQKMKKINEKITRKHGQNYQPKFITSKQQTNMYKRREYLLNQKMKTKKLKKKKKIGGNVHKCEPTANHP